MDTQGERTRQDKDRRDPRDVKSEDLKASDFFPPGVGWNQAGGGEDEEEVNRRERERRDERDAGKH